MGDIVQFPTALIDDHDFILAMARFADGLLTEAQIKKRFNFDENTWKRLGENEPLIAAIEAEKERRIRNGETARERAQKLFVEAPTVLGTIMNDGSASPRHRIEAAREIRQVAANGPEVAPAADRFVITIDLGGDHVLKFDKSIKVDPNDTDPNSIEDTPRELIPSIAANKRKDEDSGEPV